MVLLQNHNNSTTATVTQTGTAAHLSSSSSSYDVDTTETPRFSEDFDSTCSTPYVSAPSSPGCGPTSGYFFSAPASPMHFVLSSAPSATCHLSYDSSLISVPSDASSFEFEFSSRFSSCGSLAVGSMSSADELFLNGQIRPMKLSSHLQRPQILAPVLDLDVEDDDGSNNREASRGRDLKIRSRSLHRKMRSLSPLRNAEFQWEGGEEECSREEQKEVSQRILEGLKESVTSNETTPSCSASSSRSSSSGRNSKKWIFLKDLLHRSKSEGRRENGKEKPWTSISFSPSKENKIPVQDEKAPPLKQKQKENKQGVVMGKKVSSSGKPANGVAKRRVPPSPHELHYTANRAQAEEMKKRTYLPYRQGLFGCLGFSSKGYGALNGLARSLNPVSSR